MTERDGWVRVGDAALWKRGRGRRVEVDGVHVAVFKDATRWMALDDTCPHMGASLADGRLFGAELQCSWHEWRYDTTTGQCPVRPWAQVRVHAVEVRDGGVWVKLSGTERPDTDPDGSEGSDPEWLAWEPSRFFKRKPEGPTQGS